MRDIEIKKAAEHFVQRGLEYVRRVCVECAEEGFMCPSNEMKHPNGEQDLVFSRSGITQYRVPDDTVSIGVVVYAKENDYQQRNVLCVEMYSIDETHRDPLTFLCSVGYIFDPTIGSSVGPFFRSYSVSRRMNLFSPKIADDLGMVFAEDQIKSTFFRGLMSAVEA